MTAADWMSQVSTLIAVSPVTMVGTVVACTCATLYAVTRAPEFLVVTATSAAYAVVAAMLIAHGC